MKTNLITGIFSFLFAITSFAQDKTTVRANNSDISDNLDLRAVATIFGDASDLEDFERRLNDPKSQISNLDLNNDNYVDYLRVIESIEGNAHIIVIQAVLDKDLYQDVASVEVEKDNNNNIQVQVVGDVYMYGDNYIYEPVYVHRPVIYTNFWISNYRPYYSTWYWNYYPTYYTYYRPFPIFRYRNHITIHINFGNTYNYVSTRRCAYAYNSYYGRRANAYERRYPNRSFSYRNSGYSNRYELDQNRNIRTRVSGSRELTSNRNSSSVRNNRISSNENGTRTSSTRRNDINGTTPRISTSTRNNTNSGISSPRVSTSTRSNTNSSISSPRVSTSTRSNTNSSISSPRVSTSTRSNTSSSISSPRVSTRSNANMGSSRGNSTPKNYSESRSSSSNRSSTQTRSTTRQSGNSSGSRSSSSGRENSGRGGRS